MRVLRIGSHERKYYAAAAGLLLVFFFLTIGSILIGHLSLTTDEPQHFRYGKQILEGNPDRFVDSAMPLSALNALAAKVATAVAGKWIETDWQAMSAGRVATVVFSAGVAVLCAAWAGELGGKGAALLALGLYVFEPNLIAHSSLVTTDIFAAGTMTLALYLFWRFLEKPSFGRAALGGLGLGVALIGKYTSVLLFLVLPLLALLRFRVDLLTLVRRDGRGGVPRLAVRLVGWTLVGLAVAALVVNLGFLFNRTGTRFGDYAFRSPELIALQASSPLLRSVPIPLPYPYLDGLDWVMEHDRTGETHARLYLLGTLKREGMFPGYFLVATLYKVPLGILALFGLAIINWGMGVRRGKPEWGRTYLLVAIGIFALYFNLMFRAQIGIRYFLVAFPPAIIFTAQLAARWGELRKSASLALAGLGIYAVVSVLSYFPDYIPYFNELVLDRRLAYRILSDSNIMWGQSNAAVEETLSRHPDYIFQPDEPTAGTIVVGVNELTGIYTDPEQFRWLRDNFKPDGAIRYTHLFYEISPEELDSLDLSGMEN